MGLNCNLQVGADEQNRHHSKHSETDFDQWKGIDDEKIYQNLEVEYIFVWDCKLLGKPASIAAYWGNCMH